MEHKILSCIPLQLTNLADKLNWINKVCQSFKPHILVTPQEYFGGAFIMSNQKDFYWNELYPKLKKISIKYCCALVIGVQERDNDGTNKSAIWFINEKGEFLGRLCKLALPKYDHVDTNGYGSVTPELSFENRFKCFKLHNLYVSAIFCWEVYSDLLWTGLGILKPDVIFSLIKFGVNSWPIVKKVKKKNEITGFGYGKWAEEDEGGWIQRLKMANVWQVKCPIICSTNSWSLNPRSMPLCGSISGIDGQAITDLWYPKKTDALKEIPEKITISSIDENKVRGALQNKYTYKELVGSFPPMSINKYTMHLKMNRIETRILKGTNLKTKTVKNGIFN